MLKKLCHGNWQTLQIRMFLFFLERGLLHTFTSVLLDAGEDGGEGDGLCSREASSVQNAPPAVHVKDMWSTRHGAKRRKPSSHLS